MLSVIYAKCRYAERRGAYKSVKLTLAVLNQHMREAKTVYCRS